MHTAVRLGDFLLWSTLELVCLYRSPLLLQLKLWMQEKMAAFDERVRAMLLTSPGGPQSPLLRSIGGGGGARESRRVSTIFAKPRQRSVGNRSNAASPEGSPAFGAISGGGPGSSNLSRSPSLLSLGPRANESPLEKYDRFPNASPTPGATSGPRILHLGPTKKANFGLGFGRLDVEAQQSTINEDDETMQRAALTRLTVTSPSLVRASHRRVRVVQSSMGYDPLPMEDDEDGDEADVRVWSKARAVTSIMTDSRALVQEFGQWFGLAEEAT